MDAISILKHYRDAEKDVNELRKQIERKRDTLTALPTLKTDNIGGGHDTTDKDRTGRILADIDLLEREIEARNNESSAESIAAVTFLDRLPSFESEIMYMYYIKRQDTGEIAKKLSYSPGYIRKIKMSAEKKLEYISFDELSYLLPKWYIEGKQAI